MRMTDKRFRLDTGCIIDMQENKVLTEKQANNLLNKLHKELKPIQEVCDKYNIPIKDLPEILEEYIAYDNDDNW